MQMSISMLLTCPEGHVLGNTIGQASNGCSNMGTMTKAIIIAVVHISMLAQFRLCPNASSAAGI